MWEKIVVAVVVIPLAILIIRGLWRATAVQSETGCPVCDAIQKRGQGNICSHDHPNHGHAQGHTEGTREGKG